MHCFGLNHLRFFLLALFTFKSLKDIFHQLQCEMMVRVNDPHPLHYSTTEFLTTSLQEHFKGGPEKWNFVKGK